MAHTRERCPCCGAWMKLPETMAGLELRAIRGVVGVRLGYRGPMPQAKFCRWLFVSPRTLWNYEQGKTAIPPLVAKEARRLREDETLQLPASWKRQQTRWLAQRDKARRIADRIKARKLASPE